MMDMGIVGIAVHFLMGAVLQGPAMAVWIVGAILAIRFWRRDRQASLLMLLACLLSMFEVVVFGGIHLLLPQLFHGTSDYARLGAVYQGLAFVRTCVTAVAWVLVLIAVFRRHPAA